MFFWPRTDEHTDALLLSRRNTLLTVEGTWDCYDTLDYIDGSPGCNYQCVFITKKINYIDRSTDKFQLVFGKFRSILALKLKKILNLAYPRPTVYRDREGSGWISVSWSVYTTRNIHSFYLYKNQSWETIVDASTFTYNFTYLYPRSCLDSRFVLYMPYIYS